MAWHEVLGLDFVPVIDSLDTAKVTIKYKLPEGEVALPFALSGFSSQQEASLFMDMANKYVKDEVKTEAFKQACSHQEAVSAQSRIDPVAELLKPHDWETVAEHEIDRQIEARSLLNSFAQIEHECSGAKIYLREKVKEGLK